MIQGILFDLDETLLDRTASLNRFLHEQHTRYQTHFQEIPFVTFQSRFHSLDEKGYVHKRVVYQKLLAEWQIKGLTFEELLEDYQQGFRHHVSGFDNWRAVLTELRQRSYRLGIITNGETEFQQRNMDAMMLPELVDTILISQHENLRKPDPQIFERAAERLGVAPADCLFVGDHPANDIAGARNAGMRTVWFANSFAWPDDLPRADHEIDSLNELFDILS
ncbi:hypothetical protein CIG75_09370 [Tumebacillus algifaecis]|uniref:HAD family hydrolase n=1 Tax=Tumebacillus algifaecis TaxID=1214604 RepID=A0A223D0N5_9BACL|nr:HAD family hydrolase [Tumebacillus algifaecis]ASS75170.1 hypothetical protein CIG75_09370 [Tumebacillus algifaecis]